jgi:hypothetical protein
MPPTASQQTNVGVIIARGYQRPQQGLLQISQSLPQTYHRHKPEETTLYRVVQENLETFLSQVNGVCGRARPDFVEKEFREYSTCGIMAHGFLRAKCESCRLRRPGQY